MGKIEAVMEAAGHYEPDYTRKIGEGRHRKGIGGHWDTHGLHQLDFLKAHGLQPEHRLLDVGCGSFRAGRHFVDYLEPENYYAIDANQSLMQAGYDKELTNEQRAKLPTGNLRASDRFGVDFSVKFDIALAQSVFTHLSLNNIRLCLYRVAQQMRPGGIFFVTFNEQRPSVPVDKIITTKKRKYTERNVYWYYRSDIRWAASIAPWEYRYIGKWGHPGGQRMIAFTRLSDDAAPVRSTTSTAPASVVTEPMIPPPH